VAVKPKTGSYGVYVGGIHPQRPIELVFGSNTMKVREPLWKTVDVRQCLHVMSCIGMEAEIMTVDNGFLQLGRKLGVGTVSSSNRTLAVSLI
jgi:hypothetical protein